MGRHVKFEPLREVGNVCLLVALLYRDVSLRSVRRLATRQRVMRRWLRSLVNSHCWTRPAVWTLLLILPAVEGRFEFGSGRGVV